MSQRKCAVISCPGLGDGLLSLIVSNNMHLNGWEVTTYHDKKLCQLQQWFPHLPIVPFSHENSLQEFLSSFEKIFVSYSTSSKYIQNIISEGKKPQWNNVTVLNPCCSRSQGKQPFYEDACFSSNVPMVENLQQFCENILLLPKTTKSNGLIVPYDLVYRKYKKRVVIHPTSAKKGKCWSFAKYIKLAKQLKKEGFKPVFIADLLEQKKIEQKFLSNIEMPHFSHLGEVAKFIYESGYMIGNDSGIGHLASCLEIPTISLFRNNRVAKLWRPAWMKGEIVSPSPFIPNIAGFRLRDKKWQKFVSIKKILKRFHRLTARMFE